MQIGNAASYALSGMRAQTERLAQSAQNVAHVNTDGYQARNESAATLATGGSAVAGPQTYGRFSASPISLDGSSSPASTTDLVGEQVTQLSSLRAFQANVAVLRTADAMTGELLDRNA
jgi:flagellar basal-body rod protein FlgC